MIVSCEFGKHLQAVGAFSKYIGIGCLGRERKFMVELDVKIGSAELFDYMLMHSYNSPIGILGSCLGGLVGVMGAIQQRWSFVFFGLILLLYTPITLYSRSKRQAAAEVFQKPLHYVLDEQGLTISQDEVSTQLEWDAMVKAVSTNKSIILYTSTVNATIIPKAQMGDLYGAVLEMISTHMPPKKVKIRA